MRGDKTGCEHHDADPKRTAADPEKLIEIALQSVRAMGKISLERFAEFARRRLLDVAVGKMNDDPDLLIGGQFARPADDIILGLAIEIALAKWEWVERMKQLRDLVDPQLYRFSLRSDVMSPLSTALVIRESYLQPKAQSGSHAVV